MASIVIIILHYENGGAFPLLSSTIFTIKWAYPVPNESAFTVSRGFTFVISV